MAVIPRLDSIALRDLRRLLWQAGDREGADQVTQELLRRVSMGQILPEDIMCSEMNRHRPMSYGKERSWHRGRIATGRFEEA